MDNRPIPSLSTDNFIYDPLIKLRNIYSYFKISEYSQSNTYLGNVISLKYLIEQNSNVSSLTGSITDNLTILFNRYFSKADVFCELTDNDDGSKSIKITAEVTDADGVVNDLSDIVKIKDNKIIKD